MSSPRGEIVEMEFIKIGLFKLDFSAKVRAKLGKAKKQVLKFSFVHYCSTAIEMLILLKLMYAPGNKYLR
jgi:hypothetical protein